MKSWHHESWNTLFYGLSAFSALATLLVIGRLSFQANRIAGSLLGLEKKRTLIETRPHAWIEVRDRDLRVLNKDLGDQSSPKQWVIPFRIHNKGHKCEITELFYEIYNSNQDFIERKNLPNAPFEIDKESVSQYFVMEGPTQYGEERVYYRVFADICSVDTKVSIQIEKTDL
jgi:hypothetical protein